MNTVCFDAFGYGNRFDGGDGVLKSFLDQLYTADCRPPSSSATSCRSRLPLAPSGTPVHKPYLVKTYDGVKVGIIGANVAGKAKASSRPLAGTQFLDETTTTRSTSTNSRRRA